MTHGGHVSEQFAHDPCPLALVDARSGPARGAASGLVPLSRVMAAAEQASVLRPARVPPWDANHFTVALPPGCSPTTARYIL